jgi:hypothetical protein
MTVLRVRNKLEWIWIRNTIVQGFESVAKDACNLFKVKIMTKDGSISLNVDSMVKDKPAIP